MSDAKPIESLSPRRFRWEIVLLPPGVLLLLFALWYPYTDGARQKYNMDLAERYRPYLQAKLDADPRFSKVQALVYTDLNGSLGLFGTVETEDDLNRLLRLVSTSRIGVPVFWLVRVRPK